MLMFALCAILSLGSAMIFSIMFLVESIKDKDSQTFAWSILGIIYTIGIALAIAPLYF